MNIDKEYNEKELTLTVNGRIDTITSKDLENAINDEIGNFDSLIWIFPIWNTFQVQALGF